LFNPGIKNLNFLFTICYAITVGSENNITSSVVAAMEYDESLSTLRITYVSGKVYDYKNVPPEVYEEMKEAESKGTFLNYRIKGKYRYKRVK